MYVTFVLLSIVSNKLFVLRLKSFISLFFLPATQKVLLIIPFFLVHYHEALFFFYFMLMIWSLLRVILLLLPLWSNISKVSLRWKILTFCIISWALRLLTLLWIIFSHNWSIFLTFLSVLLFKILLFFILHLFLFL